MLKTIKHPNIDSDGIFKILEVFEKLIVNQKFCQKFMDQPNIECLINVFIYNSFSTKIIEKSSSILLKSAVKNKTNIILMGLYGVNEYILNILNKYMTTCHTNLNKQFLE